MGIHRRFIPDKWISRRAKQDGVRLGRCSGEGICFAKNELRFLPCAGERRAGRGVAGGPACSSWLGETRLVGTPGSAGTPLRGGWVPGGWPLGPSGRGAGSPAFRPATWYTWAPVENVTCLGSSFLLPSATRPPSRPSFPLPFLLAFDVSFPPPSSTNKGLWLSPKRPDMGKARSLLLQTKAQKQTNEVIGPQTRHKRRFWFHPGLHKLLSKVPLTGKAESVPLRPWGGDRTDGRGVSLKGTLALRSRPQWSHICGS